MARVEKPLYLRRPREADANNGYVSLSDHAYKQPVDPRRRPEIADSQMIKEDHSAVANLSPSAINRQFTPGKFSPHYWMESEVRPFGVQRLNEPEDEF